MMKLILHMLQFFLLAAANNLEKRGSKFILDVIKNADSTGIKSVENI